MPKQGIVRQVMPALALVSQLTGLTVAGVLVGLKLDDLFQTRPWMIMLGTISGFGFGVFSLIRSINRTQPAHEDTSSHSSK